MKKAIILVGVPGTGKTTATWKLLEYLENKNNSKFSYFKEGLVVGHRLNNIEVIGDYSDSSNVFSGTDRLSMAVAPEFKEYISKNNPEIIFLEGDRLGSNSIIDYLSDKGYEIKVVGLTAPKEILQERYSERGSNQPEQFLKAKNTKVNSILTRMDLVLDDAILEIDSSKITPEKIAEQIGELFN